MVRILKLWLKHFFSLEVINIIKGNFNRLFNRKESLFEYRYRMCRHCFHKETIESLGEVCGICGCPLQSKLRVEDEKCDLEKW